MKAYITIGLPASGKTIWAKGLCESNPNIIRINNDDIRNGIYAEIGYRLWTKNIESRVRDTREYMIGSFSTTNDIVIDNTHLNPSTFESTKNKCEYHGYEIEIVDFRHVPLTECIERDKLRSGPDYIGEKVIRDMHDRFMSTPIDSNLPSWTPNKLPNAIIVDIDGTLAQMRNRGPYDEHLVYNDEVRHHVLYVVHSLLEANTLLKVFIFSGRTDNCRKETVRWLYDKCDFNIAVGDQFGRVGEFDVELHMRKTGDRRKDSSVKLDIYNEFVKDKYNVVVVFDDRPQVIRECWKVLNLPVFNCGLIDVEF